MRRAEIPDVVPGPLGGLPIADGPAREMLARCRRGSREVRLAKGQALFSRGDPNEGLYVILQGEITIVMVSALGVDHAVEILTPGQALGESCLLGEPFHTESALAACDSRLAYLPRELLLEEFRRTPTLRLRLLAEMSTHLRRVMLAAHCLG